MISVKCGNWRIEASARSDRLRFKADALPQGPNQARVYKHLDRADDLIRDRQNPVELWTGTQVESAWSELRLAEELLIQARFGDPEIVTYAQVALQKAHGRLDDADGRVTALTNALSVKKRNSAQLKSIGSATLEVAQATHELSDQQHRGQREFRSLLRILSIGLAILAIVAVIAAVVTPPPAEWVSGYVAASAPWHVIAAAFLLGGMGALFSAIPSMTLYPSNSTTFNPTMEQAALKVVVGAWSAVVGLIAVSTSLAKSPIDSEAATPASAAGFAMICALFGATQEALTRFADKKASDSKPVTST